MAIFSNQATLTYNGSSTNSNIAYGEILDVLTVTKTAVEGSYTPGTLVTYVVTLRNTGTSTLTGLTVTDNLGGYDFNGTTVYPLTYETGSAVLFANGVLQPTPAVTAGPPLVISGISVPGNGDVVRDLEYFQQIYPTQVRRYQQRVSQILDRMDYEGSMIYDEYPDRFGLMRLSQSMLEIIKQEERSRDENLVDTPEKWEWVEALIFVLLNNEVYKRRLNGRRGFRNFS